jgi:hypothetical protein
MSSNGLQRLITWRLFQLFPLSSGPYFEVTTKAPLWLVKGIILIVHTSTFKQFPIYTDVTVIFTRIPTHVPQIMLVFLSSPPNGKLIRLI